MKTLRHVYHVLWTVAVALSLPVLPFVRKGRLLRRLFPSPPPPPRRSGVIWVHALSLGEVISAVPLVRALRERFPQKELLFTATTAQGLETAATELGDLVREVRPMPLDFWLSVSRFVDMWGPDVYVLVETDIWPGLLMHLKRKGVPALLVNGRVSPRSYRAYLRFRCLFRHLFRGFFRCLMQTDLDRERLLGLGLEPERVMTSGNLKFDRDWEPLCKEERFRWLKDLALGHARPVFVAGSTHPGEEEMVLGAFSRARERVEDLALIIAPRRVERAAEVQAAARSVGFRTALRSSGTPEDGAWDVMILDTIGELGRVYGLGKVAYVGGSLVPVGGHNLLEPAAFGCPVLFGPYTHNFEEMAEALAAAGGGRRVHDPGALSRAVEEILANPGTARDMGKRARDFVEKNRGALNRVLDEVAEALDAGDGNGSRGGSR